jgi:hypothetical protein
MGIASSRPRPGNASSSVTGATKTSHFPTSTGTSSKGQHRSISLSPRALAGRIIGLIFAIACVAVSASTENETFSENRRNGQRSRH